MPFSDLFRTYPNRNMELRSVARQAYEFGKTVSKEQSAAMSTGLLKDAIDRQTSYIEYMEGLVDALGASPIPDLPATNPTNFEINLSDPYITFSTNVAGEKIPINEQTELVAQYWMILAVELANSQSAALGGSLNPADLKRAKQNLASLKKVLAQMTGKPTLDLPETAEPGADYGLPGK